MTFLPKESGHVTKIFWDITWSKMVYGMKHTHVNGNQEGFILQGKMPIILDAVIVLAAEKVK